ncbi:MAG: NAD(P)H-dependent oxidoreductase [Thermodesulfobacteriota bacterium]
MSKLLYIKASPRGERSYSVSAADSFVRAYQESHPEDEIVTLDLFKTQFPEFDGLVIESKYVILHGLKHTEEQLQAWREVERIIEEFKSADKYVIATPMWNFGIPYKLKHYIDILVQPSYTFNYSPEEGYTGLVTGKPIMIVYARGGEYPSGTPWEMYDLQTKYLEVILGFIGFTDIRKLVVEPTLLKGPDFAKEQAEKVKEKAEQLAKDF